MKDSDWFQPFLGLLVILAFAGVSWMSGLDKPAIDLRCQTSNSASTECSNIAGSICLAGVILIAGAFTLFRSANRPIQPDWVKPVARVIDGETIEVRGSVDELIRMGVPGVVDWIHIDAQKWHVRLLTPHGNRRWKDEAGYVVDLINNWNGSTQ